MLVLVSVAVGVGAGVGVGVAVFVVATDFIVAMIFVQHIHEKLVPSYSHQIADLNCHLFFALAETTALFSR